MNNTDRETPPTESVDASDLGQGLKPNNRKKVRAKLKKTDRIKPSTPEEYATHPTPESEGVEKRIQEFAEEYAGILEESEIAWHGTNPEEAKEEAARIEKTVVDRLRALLAQARQEERERVTGADRPWPLVDVLKKLFDATEKLLFKRDYDGHGYEGFDVALEEAKYYISQLQGGSDE